MFDLREEDGDADIRKIYAVFTLYSSFPNILQ